MRACRSPGMKGARIPGGDGGAGWAVAGPARGTPAASTAMAVERRKSLLFRMPGITQGTGQGLRRESSGLARAAFGIVYGDIGTSRGEGGILALMGLVRGARAQRPGLRATLVVLGVFGASLLYGDGMITPAISVLSAIEGLEVVTPFFAFSARGELEAEVEAVSYTHL